MTPAVAQQPTWPPPAPGWVRDASSGEFRWWDGRQYTWHAVRVGSEWRLDRMPPPRVAPVAAKASPRARYSAIGAILAAGATLAWMMLASEETACQSGPTRPSSYVEPSSVFLPWLAFVVAATMLAVVHNRLALDVPWVKRWSLVTLIAAVVLCPIGPLFMLSVMNCGM